MYGSLILMLVLVGLTVVLLSINIWNWHDLNFGHFEGGTELQPGDSYAVDGQTFQLPELELKGKAYKLKEPFMKRQRQVLQGVTDLLQSLNIEHWVSGGTLLGLQRHGTLIPWDDDIDIHTHLSNREFLFSDSFKASARAFNLRTVMLRFGTSVKSAGREGACVRLRPLDSKVPVCDIFFVAELQGAQKETHLQKLNAARQAKHAKAVKKYNRHLAKAARKGASTSVKLEKPQPPEELDTSRRYVAKVNGWASEGKVLTFEPKETYKHDDVFPIKSATVGDLRVFRPARPETVLCQQYGADVMHTMHTTSPWISHRYPFTALDFVWKE